MISYNLKSMVFKKQGMTKYFFVKNLIKILGKFGKFRRFFHKMKFKAFKGGSLVALY
jgi:hypothetical protein